MTNEEKLKVAIEYAEGKGYSNPEQLETTQHFRLANDKVRILTDTDEIGLFNILFSHDFLKAVFGERDAEIKEFDSHKWKKESEYEDYHWCSQCERSAKVYDGSCDPFPQGCKKLIVRNEGWRYHAREMVINPDPLNFVYEFITKQL